MAQAIGQRVVVPSTLAEVAKVQQAILHAVEQQGYSEHARFGIRLALDEALANAVHHGNHDDPTKHVTVEYKLDDVQLCVSVCDEGCGFRPDCVPDCTQEHNLMKPNGRGVMLMKAYMTAVSYNDCGNCVTIVKRRDCPLPQSAG